MITHYTYYTPLSTIDGGTGGPCQQVDADFNDVTGEITNLVFGSIIPSYDGSLPYYGQDELIFANVDWELRSNPSFVPGTPFGPYAVSLAPSCDVVIVSISAVALDSGMNTGTATINATGTGVLEYRLTKSGFDTGWLLTHVFAGLVAGDYIAYTRQQSNIDCLVTTPFIVYYSLLVDVVGFNPTAIGANDGIIQAFITRGSGSYNITIGADSRNLSGSDIAAEFDNFAPVLYTVVFTDLISGDIVNVPQTLTDPQIVLPKDSYFNVPWFQSLQFVHEVDTDECEELETLDNLRFCKQVSLGFGFTESPYYQKVCLCDLQRIQIKSNYASHKVSIIRESDGVVVNDTTSIDKVIPNIGVSDSFDIVIKNGGLGTSRIYFTTQAIPLVLNPGDIFGITGDATFNGNYAIVGIGVDTITAFQYLVINKNYPGPDPSVPATGVFLVTAVDFDIYETIIDLSTYPSDYYYIKIEAFDSAGALGGIPALSEPLFLADKHPGTNQIKWYNIDAAFDMNYSTGIQSMIRLDSIFFKRNPGGLQDALRNTTGQPRVIRGQFQRKAVFQISFAPPWVMEKMGVALVLTDKKFIQGQEVYSESFPTPTYEDQFKLATVDVPIELVNTFETYNKTDLDGTEVNGNTLLGNGGALLRIQE